MDKFSVSLSNDFSRKAQYYFKLAQRWEAAGEPEIADMYFDKSLNCEARALALRNETAAARQFVQLEAARLVSK